MLAKLFILYSMDRPSFPLGRLHPLGKRQYGKIESLSGSRDNKFKMMRIFYVNGQEHFALERRSKPG